MEYWLLGTWDDILNSDTGELPAAVAEKAAGRKHSSLQQVFVCFFLAAQVIFGLGILNQTIVLFYNHLILLRPTPLTLLVWRLKIGWMQGVFGPRAASTLTAWRRVSSTEGASMCTWHTRMLRKSMARPLPKTSRRTSLSWSRRELSMKKHGTASILRLMMRYLVSAWYITFLLMYCFFLNCVLLRFGGLLPVA